MGTGSSLKCVRCFPPDANLCLLSPENCSGKNTCMSSHLITRPAHISTSLH
ncbi:Protein psiR [Clarias magur]|uniref:Protein psiR n=1 Tax=Clarias magur TaxID=1594786 RepID=A0A8J4U3T1_CLAMG|nr:Protein psiR [Clarias magur]